METLATLRLNKGGLFCAVTCVHVHTSSTTLSNSLVRAMLCVEEKSILLVACSSHAPHSGIEVRIIIPAGYPREGQARVQQVTTNVSSYFRSGSPCKPTRTSLCKLRTERRAQYCNMDSELARTGVPPTFL